jgi:hypothetical protein
MEAQRVTFGSATGDYRRLFDLFVFAGERYAGLLIPILIQSQRCGTCVCSGCEKFFGWRGEITVLAGGKYEIQNRNLC